MHATSNFDIQSTSNEFCKLSCLWSKCKVWPSNQNHYLVGSFNQSTTYLAICSQPALQRMKPRSKCMINPDTAESNIWQNYHLHPPKQLTWNNGTPKKCPKGRRQFLSPKHQNFVTSTSSISEFFDWKEESPGLPGSQRHSFKRSSELCRRKGNEAPPWPSNNGAPIAGGWPKAVGAVGPPLLEKKRSSIFLGRKSRVWQVLFFFQITCYFCVFTGKYAMPMFTINIISERNTDMKRSELRIWSSISLKIHFLNYSTIPAALH